MATDLGVKLVRNNGSEIPVVAVVGLSGSDIAGGGSSTSPTTAGSYQQMTNLVTSTPLASIPADATKAQIIPDVAGVRWRADGTAPTATVGQPLPVGSYLTLYGAEIAAARFIQQSSGAVLNVYYSK